MHKYRYAIKRKSKREERLINYVSMGLNDFEISKLLDISPITSRKTRERLGLERGNEDAQ